MSETARRGSKGLGSQARETSESVSIQYPLFQVGGAEEASNGRQRQVKARQQRPLRGLNRRQGLKSRDFSGKRNRMSRLYEVMFIVRPDVVEEEVDKLIAGFNTSVTNGGGSIKTIEKMGRRKLAYTVRKFNDGNYVLFTVEADGPVVLELERRLRVTEPVIKFITVRIDEEEKRLAKVKALRGVRRKPEPVVHAAAPVAAVVAPVAVEAAVVAAPEAVAVEAAEPVQAAV